MRRRDFITLVGGAAATWPLAARARLPANAHRIAVVRPSGSVADMTEAGGNPIYRALFSELQQLDISSDKSDRGAIFRRGKPGTLCRTRSRGGAYKATSYPRGFDPLGADLQSRDGHDPDCWNHGRPRRYGRCVKLGIPGGNVTGVSVDAGLEIWAKRLQILQEVVPTARKVGYLNLRSSWDLAQGRALQEAARRLGIALSGPPLEQPIQETEYRRVLGTMSHEHLDGLIVSDIADNFTHRRLIVSLAEIARLPTIYPYRAYFEDGGLMVYGSNLTALYRRVASYIDQILRGAKPGEIPIYLEAKFELLINLKATRALGLAVPTSLLVRADEVIE